MKAVALWWHQKPFPPFLVCGDDIRVRPAIADHFPQDKHERFLEFVDQDACLEELREVQVKWLIEHHDIDESI